MSRSKYGFSGLIDSDSDDGQLVARSFPTPDSAAENKAPAKKGRPKATATMPAKVTKAKAPARRTSGRLNAKSKDIEPTKAKPAKVPAAKWKRTALADKTNQQVASDTEEVDEFEQEEDTTMMDELDASIVAAKHTKPKATKKTAATGRGKAAKGAMKEKMYVVEDLVHEIPQTQLEPNPAKKKALVKRKAAPEPSPEKVIQETQVEDMEVDDAGDEEEVVQTTVSRAASNARRPRSQSRPRQPPLQPRRAGSASDTERSDPALRRKLGDITKKFENLSVKYQDLREIGLKEAERNFERLKRQSEEKTAGKYIKAVLGRFSNF